MRDRLVNLMWKGEREMRSKGVVGVLAEKQFLADYLLANGVIVPPCKVGDKLYIVADVSKKIIECTIIGVWLYEHSCTVITDDGTIHNKSLGKTVFLTKEEAEQALQKRGVEE